MCLETLHQRLKKNFKTRCSKSRKIFPNDKIIARKITVPPVTLKDPVIFPSKCRLFQIQTVALLMSPPKAQMTF